MTGEAEASTDPAEDAALRELEDALTGRSGESMVSEYLARHIVTRITDEGLIIELFDAPDAKLFKERSAEPTDLMYALAGLLSELVGLARNGIAVEGFTRSRAVVLAENPVWSLSSDRADRMRRLLEKDGVEAERIRRVTGHADRKPVVRDTMAVRNNRIEVILLRSKL